MRAWFVARRSNGRFTNASPPKAAIAELCACEHTPREHTLFFAENFQKRLNGFGGTKTNAPAMSGNVRKNADTVGGSRAAALERRGSRSPFLCLLPIAKSASK